VGRCTRGEKERTQEEKKDNKEIKKRNENRRVINGAHWQA
jgi:hypothetical protein